MSIDQHAQGTAKKKGLFGGILGGGKTYFLFAIIAAVGAAFAVLSLLGQSTDRTTYYVLSQDVPERAQITPELLSPVEIPVGAEPANALSLADVSAGDQFALIPLRAGDPVTQSVVGPLERLSTNLPDNFSVASFTAAPKDAVAGNVRTGDLIDIYATDDNGNTKLVLYRVLVVDVAVDPETIGDAANSGQVASDLDPGPQSNAVRGGIPQVYTVGLSQPDVATLAAVSGTNLFIALSPNKAEDSVSVGATTTDVFSGGQVHDSSAGVNFTADMGAVQNGQATPGAAATPAPSATPFQPQTSGPGVASPAPSAAPEDPNATAPTDGANTPASESAATPGSQ